MLVLQNIVAPSPRPILRPRRTMQPTWAKIGLVLQKGAHFQDVLLISFANPPLPGPLRPLLNHRRTTQPTAVISVWSACLFGFYGPGAREGCTIPRCLFSLESPRIHDTVVFSVPLGVRGLLRGPSLGSLRALPWGSHGGFYGHDEQRNQPS